MKIKKSFVKRKIGDKYLVVTTGEAALQSNMFIELNETSSDIWDYIQKGYDVHTIAEKLSKKYAVTYEKAQSDVEKLIAAMKAEGIFEE